VTALSFSNSLLLRPMTGPEASSPPEPISTGKAGQTQGCRPADEPLGCGPNRDRAYTQEPYTDPAVGWGAALTVGRVLVQQGEPLEGVGAIARMNHENGGYDCPGCAWPDDRKGQRMDICENGIKHVTWEMTRKRVERSFFETHSVSELRGWSDFALEDQGRLTEPMRYDPTTDHYVPISWSEAFALVGEHLRSLENPNQAAFYTSGRLSNEATFLYQWFVRAFGTNNFPDCSNMCHEASGRALMAAIGTGKGTVDLDDWQKSDCLIVMGANSASNTPRMLTSLVEAYERGAAIVHVNPLIEAASREAIIPHDLWRMVTNHTTPTSTLNLQPTIAGDMALLRGVAKHLLETSRTDPKAIDHNFLERHTSGFEVYADLLESTPWEVLVSRSGLSEDRIRAMGEIYRQSRSVIISWCLGITQQEHGVDTIREILNLLLLRGNIGREGAGPCPIRGHSNVQGNRTLGVNHQPPEAWLAAMDRACGLRSPREPGLDTVRVIPAMAEERVKVFMAMGGNFALACPDTPNTAAALARCALTVQVSTKLNRSHLAHGSEALILPCLGRTESDYNDRGERQFVTVEDSMSMVHASHGRKKPASEHLLSEAAIVAGIARETLPDSPTPWHQYASDYNLLRDKIAEAVEGFEDFNRRVQQPLGFRLRQPARELVFNTPTGKACFSDAELPDPGQRVVASGPEGSYVLATVRSHDQWNTTIYSDDDRYRGVHNLRTLVFMNPVDMGERGWQKFDQIDLTSYAKDGTTREVKGYRVIPYDLPRGCLIGYMPEMNVLCAAGDYSPQSDQPLTKHLVVTLARHGQAVDADGTHAA